MSTTDRGAVKSIVTTGIRLAQAGGTAPGTGTGTGTGGVDAAVAAEIAKLLATPGTKVVLTDESRFAIQLADGRIVALPSLAQLTDMLPQPHQAIADHFNRSPDALVSLLGDAADGSITRESVASVLTGAFPAKGGHVDDILAGIFGGLGGAFQAFHNVGLPTNRTYSGGIADQSQRLGNENARHNEVGESGQLAVVGAGQALGHLAGLGQEVELRRQGEITVISNSSPTGYSSAGIGLDIGHLGGLGNYDYNRASLSDEFDAGMREDGTYDRLFDGDIALRFSNPAARLTLGSLRFGGSEDGPIRGNLFSNFAGNRITSASASYDLAAGTLQIAADGSFVFTPTPGYSGNLPVVFTLTDSATGEQITAPTVITVAAAADAITLSGSATGNEDTAIPLPMTITLQDTDGSESLHSVVLTGVPPGAVLAWTIPPGNNGHVVNNGAGGYIFTGKESEIRAILATVNLTPPTNFSGRITLDLAATSIEDHADPSVPGYGSQLTTHASYHVDVIAVADQPTVTAPDPVTAPYNTLEDHDVALTGLGGALVDTDTSEGLTFRIEGVPSGASFLDSGGQPVGTSLGGGNWTFTSAAIAAGLTFRPPTDYVATVDMTLVSIARESSNGSTADNSTPFRVIITGLNGVALSSTPANGVEDTQIAFGDKVTVTIADPDGSETLTALQVTGLPVGSTLYYTDPSGNPQSLLIGPATTTFDVPGATDAQLRAVLASLKVMPPHNSDTDFTLTINATSHDTDGSIYHATVAQTVVVKGDATGDAPTLTASTGGAEDTTFALTVNVGLPDSDGSETLDKVTITGIPTGAHVTWPGGLPAGVTATGSDAAGWTFRPATTAYADTVALETFLSTGLRLTPPLDSDVNFNLTVRAYNVESNHAGAGSDTGATPVTELIVPVNVTPVVDAIVIAGASSVVEDHSVNVGHDILAGLTEGESAVGDTTEQVTRIVITGLPTDLASLSYPGDGTLAAVAGVSVALSSAGATNTLTIQLTGAGTEADLRTAVEQIALKPHLNSDADIPLGISVTVVDTDPDNAADTATRTVGGSHLVTVVADAAGDQPSVTGSASGVEDTLISLPITVTMQDTDGSETLSKVELTGIPHGATVSWTGLPAGASATPVMSGADIVGYTFTPANTTYAATTALQAFLAGNVKITPPADSGADFDLTVKAYSVESNLNGAGGSTGATPFGTGTIHVTVTPALDSVTLPATTSTINEDLWVKTAEDGSAPTYTGDTLLLGNIVNTSLVRGADKGVFDAADTTEGVGRVVLGNLPKDTVTYTNPGPTDAVRVVVAEHPTTHIQTFTIEANPAYAGPALSSGALETAIRATLVTFWFSPVADDSTDVPVSVAVYTQDTDPDAPGSSIGLTLTGSATHTIVVNARADTPTVTGDTKTTNEDTPVALTNLSAALRDHVGSSETLSIELRNVDTGATFLKQTGVDGLGNPVYAAVGSQAGSTWTFTPAEITAGVFYNPKPNWSGTDNMTIAAIAREATVAGETTSDDVMEVTAPVNVTVTPVIDTTTLSGTSGGAEDTTFALTVNLAVTDTDGSESLNRVEVNGLPTGAYLTWTSLPAAIIATGSDAAGWTFTPATNSYADTVTLQSFLASNLRVTPATHSDDDFSLTVRAYTQENALGGPPQLTQIVVPVAVSAVADAVTLPSSSTVIEDNLSNVGTAIEAGLSNNDQNTSGSSGPSSETITSIVISGIPLSGGQALASLSYPSSTASVTTNLDIAGGTLTLTLQAGGTEQNLRDALKLVSLTPHANTDVDIPLTVAVTTVDRWGTAEASAPVVTTLPHTIVVQADAAGDAPAVSGVAHGNEDAVFNLPITVTMADTDGSETLDRVTIAGIPAGAHITWPGGLPATVTASGSDAAGWTFRPANTTFAATTALRAFLASNLKIQAPTDSDTDFALTVTAYNVESNLGGLGGATAATPSTTATVWVGVDPVLDGLTITGSSLVDEDKTLADGSVTVSTLALGTNIEAGISRGGDTSDGTETITQIVVGNIASGATLAWPGDGTVGAVAGATVIRTTDVGGNQILTITGSSETAIRAALKLVTLKPATDDSTDIPVSVAVTVRDDNDTGSANFAVGVDPTHVQNTYSATHNVVVNAVADAPTVTGDTKTTNEDTPVALTNLSAALRDHVGSSETLSIELRNVDTGATFLKQTGVDGLGNPVYAAVGSQAGSTWTFTPAEITAGVFYNPKPNWSGTDNMTIAAIAREATVAGETTSDDVMEVTAPVNVTVNPVLDVPTITAGSSIVNEDTAFSLGSNVAVDIVDKDGSQDLHVTLTGVPDPAGNAAPTWRADAAALGVTVTQDVGGWHFDGANSGNVLLVLQSFTITPPRNSDANFAVGISVTTTEVGGATTTVTGNHNVVVRAVADTPSVEIAGVNATPTDLAQGNEDTFIAVPITVTLNDTDSSETLQQVVVSGLPTETTADATLGLIGARFAVTDDTGRHVYNGNLVSGGSPITGFITGAGNYSISSNNGTLTVTGDTAAIKAVLLTLELKRGAHNGNDINLTATATAIESNPTADGSINAPGGEVAVLTAATADVERVDVVPITDDVVASAPASIDIEEDTPMKLTTALFGATQVDADGSEALSYQFAGLPAGASFKDALGNVLGTAGGGGTWTLTSAQFSNAYFVPPKDAYGNWDLTFTAITNESSGTSVQHTDSKSVTINVWPNPDAPTVSGSTTVVEDTPTNFGHNIAYALTDTDGSESIVEVQIGGIPAGWTISFEGGSKPTNVADINGAGFYVITGTPAEIRAAVDAFRITPPLNDDSNRDPLTPDVQLTVRVTTQDTTDSHFSNGDRATTEVKHDITLQAAADAPSVIAAQDDGREDTTFNLDTTGAKLSVALTDTDGSETIAARVLGIPTTWTVSGSNVGGGTYTRSPDGSLSFTGSQAEINAMIDGVTLKAPKDWSGILGGVTLEATSTEAATGAELSLKTATSSTTFDIVVEAVADAPTVSVIDSIGGRAGYEDTPIRIAFTTQISDKDGSETLYHEVQGLPNGATFTNAGGTAIGTQVSPGVWRFSPAEVAVLHVLPEHNSNLDFSLQVRAVSIEDNTVPLSLPGHGDAAYSSWVPLQVEVRGVADQVTPTITPVTSPEDNRFPLGSAISASLIDIDNPNDAGIPNEAVNSETLYYVITGLPSTIVPSNATFIGIGWQVLASDMPLVSIPVPANFSGDILTLAPGLSIRSVTQENDGHQTYGQRAILPGELLVSPVVDGFSWSPGVTSNEDNAISLSSLASHGFSDSDGSETVVKYTLDLSNIVDDAGIRVRIGELLGKAPAAVTTQDFIDNYISGTFTDAGSGRIEVTPAQAASLAFRTAPFLDSNKDFTFPVDALVRDTGSSLTATATMHTSFSVNLVGVADTPTVYALATYTGDAGDLIALNPSGHDFGGDSTDRDTALGRTVSESTATGGDLYYIVSGLNSQIALQNSSHQVVGQNNNDGTWLLRPADLADLHIIARDGYSDPITNGNSTTFALTTYVVENDGSRAQATTAANFTVTFNTVGGGGGNDVVPLPPAITIGAATAAEDNKLALNVTIDLDPAERLDLHPAVTVLFGNIPAGFTIEGATFNAITGKWVASEAVVEAGTVKLVPPTDFSGTLPTGMTVEAIVTNDHFNSATSGVVTYDGAPAHPLPTWTPVADGPALSLTNGTAVEDQDVTLNIAATPRDTDAASPETIVGNVLVTVPAGYSLSAGTPTGTPNQYALTTAQLTGLTLVAPLVPTHDHTTPLAITVQATTNEPGGLATTTQTFNISQVALADAPQATASDAAGSEDNAISLAGLSAHLVDLDGSEILSVKISGIPSGSILSAGGNNGDGSWTIPVASLAGLTILPPKDFSGDMHLSLDVYALEQSNGSSAVTSVPFDVHVAGVADRVGLATQAVGTINEDTSHALQLGVKLEDATETVDITFSGLLAGMSLTASSGGTIADLGGGSWHFTGTESQSNAIVLNAGHASGDVTIGVSAHTVAGSVADGFNNGPTVTGSVTATITPIADAPSVGTTAATGTALSAIALAINVTFPDLDGSETHTIGITGVPTGASLSAGTNLGSGNWQLTPAQLTGLSITVPNGAPSFTLGVTATATESANGSTASTPGTLAVTVGQLINGDGSANSLTGTAGPDIITGGAGADTLTGGSGSDTFRWQAGELGSGVDTITDFAAGTGNDKLDIQALLSGYVDGVSTLGDFVNLVSSGGNTTVQVAANGSGPFSDLAVLQGVTGLDLDSLKTQGNLIV